MKLVEVRIRNYRTIGSEQTLPVANGSTIVGPNNSGKTNLLKGAQQFFTGYRNDYAYKRSRDLTFGVGNQKSSFIARFAPTGHSVETAVYSLLDELHTMLGTKREGDEFTVSLYFTGPEDTPVYRVFPNQAVKDSNDRPSFSRRQKELVETLLKQFAVHYVPSAKSVSTLYGDLLEPFLREVAARSIEPEVKKVEDALALVAGSLNAQFATSGLDELRASFAMRGGLEELFNGFELLLGDPHDTPLAAKGQGIQSAALFASFLWITEQEIARGLQPLWLIEEPESYLHPELSQSVCTLLESLRRAAQVVTTTHSLSFVPTAVDRVRGTELTKGRTRVVTYESHLDATRRIRESLGVEFSDYFNLDLLNVFVEGPSDRRILGWLLENTAAEGVAEWPYLRRALLSEFGGVKQLEGFLKMAYEWIRSERSLVTVFDGDYAGVTSRQALQEYCGQKDVPFVPNTDFVSIRSGYAIEGLFPDQWIIDLHDEHESWFLDYSVDAFDQVEPFRIRSNRKSNVVSYLLRRAEEEEDLEWADRLVAVASAIDVALGRNAKRLGLEL